MLTSSVPTPRSAIVTGGSSGVGVALVAALLKADSDSSIFVTGTTPLGQTALHKLLTEDEYYSKHADRVHYSTGDTGDEAVVLRQFTEATNFFAKRGLEQTPHALFLNAGIGGGRYALETFDVERFDAIFRVNVRGVFLWLRAVLPELKAQTASSQIVVTSSVAGLRGLANGGPYCASKFAVNGMVLSLREELKASAPQVKVGLVCPGPIATPWWDEPARGWRDATNPPPPTKMLSPESVATACLSLLHQDASSNIESIVLDPSL